MPEETAGTPETPNVGQIRKQRIAELEMEIQQRKQNFAVMVDDRDEWKMHIIHVDTLKRELGNNEFDPGTGKRKREEIEKCQGELKKIEDECYEKYKVKTVQGLGSEITNYSMKTARQEERLQILEGKPYLLGQQRRQAQQGQDDHRQQRVKGVAEPQAGYTTGKDNATPGSPDERVQNQYTAVEATSSQSDFQSERERLNREYHERQEHKAKVQEDIGQDRPRGHEM